MFHDGRHIWCPALLVEVPGISAVAINSSTGGRVLRFCQRVLQQNYGLQQYAEVQIGLQCLLPPAIYDTE